MNATTQISFNKETEEYRVRLFIDGEYQAGADYYTDDEFDAKTTGAIMAHNARPSDKTTKVAIIEAAEYEAGDK